ncbi:hypothetical protein KIW84_013404 [Lathyrus oleraceus]|uniref:Uncharacterized protein n=1 Tax=Pisum sativum TaxID=3888 RepID=A0A9D5BK89_PEA|nr:hypothetical protein KIW84_013404 [Pisum sativum]
MVQEREVKIPAPVWEVAARAAAAPPVPPLLSVMLHGKFDCKMSCFTPEVLSDLNYFLTCFPIVRSALQTSATLLATAGENLSFPSKFSSVLVLFLIHLLDISLKIAVSFSSSAIYLYSEGQKQSHPPKRTQPSINEGQSS